MCIVSAGQSKLPECLIASQSKQLRSDSLRLVADRPSPGGRDIRHALHPLLIELNLCSLPQGLLSVAALI